MSLESPEFVISSHARQRLKTRLGVSDAKMYKVVEKAWRSEGVHHRKLRSATYKALVIYKDKHGRELRELMGYIFVFAVGPQQKTLVTVF